MIKTYPKTIILILAILSTVYYVITKTDNLLFGYHILLNSRILLVTPLFIATMICYLTLKRRIGYNTMLTCCLIIICEYIMTSFGCYFEYCMIILYLLPGVFNSKEGHASIENPKLISALSLLACLHILEFTWEMTVTTIPTIICMIFCILFILLLMSVVTPTVVLPQLMIFVLCFLATCIFTINKCNHENPLCRYHGLFEEYAFGESFLSLDKNPMEIYHAAILLKENELQCWNRVVCFRNMLNVL